MTGPEQGLLAPSAQYMHLMHGEDFTEDVFLQDRERGTGLGAPGSQATYLWYSLNNKALQMLLDSHCHYAQLYPIPQDRRTR